MHRLTAVIPRRQRVRSRVCAGIVSVLLLAGCGDDPVAADPDPADPQLPDLVLTEVVRGLTRPLDLTAPPGDPRLFVAEQGGRIRIIAEGELLPEPFLDLSQRTQATGERGLLGLAFHPDYALNGRFFVNFTDLAGEVRIVEFERSTDPDRADPTSERELLRIPQPFSNHNGGQLAFGPDGMLYIASGDGGSSGDPQGHGQNTGTLLGALLRLDVSTPGDAAIPPDNPFAGDPASGRPELWAWGLRNPWRFSFDAVDGDLYIADVGQNRWEEVNVTPADAPGLNYGWAIMEGSECFGAAGCDRSGLVEPALSYRTRVGGCSVIGGFVYRGSRIPELHGTYFYSDYCEGWLRSFRWEEGTARESAEWPVAGIGRVLSMGRDSAGELYLLAEAGRVYRIDAVPERGASGG